MSQAMLKRGKEIDERVIVSRDYLLAELLVSFWM